MNPAVHDERRRGRCGAHRPARRDGRFDVSSGSSVYLRAGEDRRYNPSPVPAASFSTAAPLDVRTYDASAQTPTRARCAARPLCRRAHSRARPPSPEAGSSTKLLARPPRRVTLAHREGLLLDEPTSLGTWTRSPRRPDAADPAPSTWAGTGDERRWPRPTPACIGRGDLPARLELTGRFSAPSLGAFDPATTARVGRGATSAPDRLVRGGLPSRLPRSPQGTRLACRRRPIRTCAALQPVRGALTARTRRQTFAAGWRLSRWGPTLWLAPGRHGATLGAKGPVAQLVEQGARHLIPRSRGSIPVRPNGESAFEKAQRPREGPLLY